MAPNLINLLIMVYVLIFFLVVILFVVTTFFLSSFYIKKKTKDMDIEAIKAFFKKNNKRRKMISSLFIVYVLVDILLTLLAAFNLISGFEDFYQMSTLYYVYGLVFIIPIVFFFVFNHYRLEKLVFGDIL